MLSKTTRGFTLIELLVTVAIVGILASIATMAYSNYVVSAKLTQAFSGMLNLGQQLEAYHQDNNSYVGACSNGTNAPLPSVPDFTVTCPSLTDSSYTVQAQGNANTNVAGFTFQLNSLGNQSTPAAPAGWPTSASCWIRDKSGDCS